VRVCMVSPFPDDAALLGSLVLPQATNTSTTPRSPAIRVATAKLSALRFTIAPFLRRLAEDSSVTRNQRFSTRSVLLWIGGRGCLLRGRGSRGRCGPRNCRRSVGCRGCRERRSRDVRRLPCHPDTMRSPAHPTKRSSNGGGGYRSVLGGGVPSGQTQGDEAPRLRVPWSSSSTDMRNASSLCWTEMNLSSRERWSARMRLLLFFQ